MNWVRTGSGVGKAKAGRRAKAAKPKKRKKTPEELALARKLSATNRAADKLFPPNCYRCGERLIGPEGGTDEGGFVEHAQTINGALVRRRECGTNCGATEGAFNE